MDMRSKTVAGPLTAVLLQIGFAACGSSTPVDPFAGSEDEAQPGSSAAASTGAFDPGSDACDPPCDTTTMCSTTGACIAWGTCAAPADCEPGLTCDAATSTCIPGGECGAQEIKGAPAVPNVLIALDRSCSMLQKNKWNYAVDAVTSMTTTFEPDIRFGLSLFPDALGDGCSQGSIPIPVGDATEPAIQSLLAAALSPLDVNFPASPCNTNIDSAMEQASHDPSFAQADHPSFVLLITDGKQQGCELEGGDAGTLSIIEDLFQQGVKTFVVGFGNGVYEPMLNTFAKAGGVPYSNPADPFIQFYKADDKAQLEAALKAIGAKALGCVFDLATPPPDPAKMYVFFNNDPKGIPNDPTNGWQYDPATNQVTFFGTSCQLLESGQVDDVDIVFGCNAPTTDPE